MTRELDRQVSEAMGYRVEQVPATESHTGQSALYWFLIGPDGEVAPEAHGWRVENHDAAAAWASVPHFSTDIAAAWTLVEHLRDQWTEATDGVSGFDDSFPAPFDDAIFFEKLHRNADRRWPWAFLYVTPEAICRAFLAAIGSDSHE